MTISLNPNVEAVVASRAAAAGVGTEEFVNDFLEQQFKDVAGENRPPTRGEITAWFSDFRRIANSEGTLPPIENFPDPNFTRESLYGDHD